MTAKDDRVKMGKRKFNEKSGGLSRRPVGTLKVAACMPDRRQDERAGDTGASFSLEQK